MDKRIKVIIVNKLTIVSGWSKLFYSKTNSIKSMQSRLLSCVLLILFFSSANAAGVDRLKAFYETTLSMRANFHQVVFDAQGKKLQEVTGRMELKRPGKFKWDYQSPYTQEIVGDGTRVWLYDPELNQVTVRAMGKAIGSSPAALLAGNKDIDKSFEFSNGNNADGMEWALAIPKEKESGFEKIELGFSKDQLKKLKLVDAFGHTTLIEFNGFERNPKLEDQSFYFKPPSGADIVGE